MTPTRILLTLAACTLFASSAFAANPPYSDSTISMICSTAKSQQAQNNCVERKKAKLGKPMSDKDYKKVLNMSTNPTH